jgi:hypothetical protein
MICDTIGPSVTLAEAVRAVAGIQCEQPGWFRFKSGSEPWRGLLKNRRVFTAFYLRSAAAYEDLTCPKQAPLVAGLFLLFCRAGLDGAVCSAGAAVGSSSITRGQNTGVSIANRVTRTHRVSGGSLTFCSTGVGTGGATRTIDR